MKWGACPWDQHIAFTFLISGPFPCSAPPSQMAMPVMGFSMELKEAPAENSDQLCPHSGWCSWNFRGWHVFLLTFALFTGTGEMARLVAFTSTLKDQSLDLKHQVWKVRHWALGTAAHSCDPSARKAETRGSLGLANYLLLSNVWAPSSVGDPVSKRKWRETEEDSDTDHWPLYGHAHVHTHTMHTHIHHTHKISEWAWLRKKIHVQ